VWHKKQLFVAAGALNREHTMRGCAAKFPLEPCAIFWEEYRLSSCSLIFLLAADTTTDAAAAAASVAAAATISAARWKGSLAVPLDSAPCADGLPTTACQDCRKEVDLSVVVVCHAVLDGWLSAAHTSTVSLRCCHLYHEHSTLPPPVPTPTRSCCTGGVLCTAVCP
jgi:hypothetical protein